MDPFADLGPPKAGVDLFADLPPKPGPPEYALAGPDAMGMVSAEHPLDLLKGAGASFVDLSKGVVQGLAGGFMEAAALPGNLISGQPENIGKVYRDIAGAFPVPWNEVLSEGSDRARQEINAFLSAPQFAGELAGEKVLGATDSPLLAAGAATAIEGAPIFIGGKLGLEALKKGGKAVLKAAGEAVPEEMLYKAGKTRTYTKADLIKVMADDPTAVPDLVEMFKTDPTFRSTVADAIRKGDISVEDVHPNWLGKILGRESKTATTVTEPHPVHPGAIKGALEENLPPGTAQEPPPGPIGPSPADMPVSGGILETKGPLDAATAIQTRDMWIRQGYDARVTPLDPFGFEVTRHPKGTLTPEAPGAVEPVPGDALADLPPAPSSPQGVSAPEGPVVSTPQAAATSPGPPAGAKNTETWNGVEYPREYKGYELAGEQYGRLAYLATKGGPGVQGGQFYVKPGQAIEEALVEMEAKFKKPAEVTDRGPAPATGVTPEVAKGVTGSSGPAAPAVTPEKGAPTTAEGKPTRLTTPEPYAPAGKRWTIDPGAMPGEPIQYLDVENKDLETAKGAVIEHTNDQGVSTFEPVLADGKSLGSFPTLTEAAFSLEYEVGQLKVTWKKAAIVPTRAGVKAVPIEEKRSAVRPARSGYPESEVPDLPTVKADLEAVRESLANMEAEYTKKKAANPLSMETDALGDRVRVYRKSVETLEARKIELQKEAERDKENIPGVPGNIQKRETAVKTEPIAAGGGKTAGSGGDVQAHGAEKPAHDAAADGAESAPGETGGTQEGGEKTVPGKVTGSSGPAAPSVTTNEGVSDPAKRDKLLLKLGLAVGDEIEFKWNVEQKDWGKTIVVGVSDSKNGPVPITRPAVRADTAGSDYLWDSQLWRNIPEQVTAGSSGSAIAVTWEKFHLQSPEGVLTVRPTTSEEPDDAGWWDVVLTDKNGEYLVDMSESYEAAVERAELDAKDAEVRRQAEESPVPEAIRKGPKVKEKASTKPAKSGKIKVEAANGEQVDHTVRGESPERPAGDVREDEGERGADRVPGADLANGNESLPGNVEEGDGSVPGGERGGEDVPAAERGGSAEPVGVARPAGVDITPKALRESLAEAYKGGPKTRAAQNIKAIRTLKQIQSENRLATPEEQQILARYVGWGGIPQIFDVQYAWQKDPHGLRPMYEELEGLLTADEIDAAKGSTRNAHYTDPEIVSAMWKSLAALGFKGPARVLEPAVGIGNFLGMVPEGQRQGLKFTGVELDAVSGQIARQLYQTADIRIQGFQDAKIPGNFYDLAISNVPFADTKILEDRAYRKHRFALHNYFIAKSIDKVRPGGLLAFITTHYTMDAKNDAFREYVAQRADLVGALRLPNTAFKKNAATEVVTDILFFRKKVEGETREAPAWKSFATIDQGTINEYFVAHPKNVLGDHSTAGSMYRQNEYTVTPREGAADGEALAKLVVKAADKWEPVYTLPVHKGTVAADLGKIIPAPEEVKEGAFFEKDGKIYEKEKDQAIPVSLEGKPLARMKGMIAFRDALRRLHRSQLMDEPEEVLTDQRKAMNAVYDGFVRDHGFLHADANYSLFAKDPDSPLVLSTEIWDVDTEKATKADIFSKRTVFPYKRAEKAETPQEAMFISLNELGTIDFGRIRELTGFEEPEIIASLAGQIFMTPEGAWIGADEYLSGNVREKLKDAQGAAQADPTFTANVEALEKVQPEDVPFTQISVTLGSPWITTEDYADFLRHILGASHGISVHHSAVGGSWTVTVPRNLHDTVAASSTWGTRDYSAPQLVDAALNMRTPTVTRRDNEGNTYTDQPATIAARQKQQDLKDEFRKWLWEDSDRRVRLHRFYNDEYNAVRLREYNGDHLTLPGQAVGITLKPHQKNGVWRGIVSGNTLLAHAVGAGKTFEMIGIAMEKRRLGLAKKTVIAEPKHLIRQVAGEFLRLYPSANILVAGEGDFSAANRQKFLSRIATGDWDAVIVTHEHFQRIPVSRETEEEIIRKELTALEAEIIEAYAMEQAAGGRRGRRGSITKALEAAKDKLEQKMKDLADQKRDENVLTFEELGIDQIIVDESHKFKNLFFPTKMRNIAGLGTSDADRAFDMYVKTTYINKVTNYKGVIFSTGTPITNTMAEIFNVQRYLQPQELEEKGLSHFDSWAANFGEVVTGLEVGVSGKYVVKSRFASFVNLPELLGMFRNVSDIQTKQMLQLPTPTIKGGGRDVNRSAPTPEYISFVKAMGVRADRIRSGQVDPRTDNMLKITSDGRDSALDMRRINNRIYSFDPAGKIAKVVENTYRIWKKGAKERQTQLIFVDRGTPTSKVEGRLNVYKELKTRLEAAGIPRNEIAFIHDAKNDEAKLGLFKKMNDGKIRILIGSTPKMGEGMNAQKRMKALHHLDVPWTPGLLEQREGRILRQGNDNGEVEIHTYITQGSLTELSFDAYMWQTLETKAKFVEQVMQGDPQVRSMEDLTGGALSFAELKAFATGNPIVMEKIRVDKDLAELTVLRSRFMEDRARLQMKVATMPESIDGLKTQIKEIEADHETIKKNTKPEFEITIMGERYTDRQKAGEKIGKIVLEQAAKAGKKTETMDLGKFRGLDLHLRGQFVFEDTRSSKGHVEYYIDAVDEWRWISSVSESALGTIASLAYATSTNVEHELKNAKETLEKREKDYKDALAQIGRKFEKEDRIKALETRKKEIDQELEKGKQTTEDLAEGGSDEGDEEVTPDQLEPAPAVTPETPKKFYRNLGSQGFVEALPNTVKNLPADAILPGWEKFDIKVVKHGKDVYYVIEGRSGLSMGEGSTRESAIEAFKNNTRTMRADKFEEIVLSQVEKQGLSPRYKKNEDGGFTLYASPLDPALIAKTFRSVKDATNELIEARRLAKKAKRPDLNWFNQAVNTPYYIFTEKFPRYRPVFDRMREMMQERDDIASSLAEQAVDFFSGLDLKEKVAVNKMLIRGRYERHVFTREELAAKNLTEKQIDAYLGIRKMLDRALDIYEDAVIHRVTKGRVRASSSLPAEVLLDVFAQLDYSDERAKQILEVIMKIRDAKRTGYAPFARFGDYAYGYVHVLADGTPDWQNPSNYFAKAETAFKAAKEYQALLKRFHKGIEEGRLIPVPPKELLQDDQKELLQDVGGFELEVLQKLMSLAPEVKDQLKEAVENLFAASGFRRHFFESKDSPGFSTDMERALADYIVGLSGFVSRLKGIPEMDAAAQGMEKYPSLARYYREWRDYTISPHEEFQRIRSGLFIYFLGGNVKSAAINLTQILVTTVPWLSQYVSVPRALTEVTNALKTLIPAMGKREDGTFGVDVAKLPKDVREIVRRGYAEGIVSEQLIYDLMGVAHKPSHLRKLSKEKQRVVRGFGFLFSIAEKANRLVTLVAAARLHQSMTQKREAAAAGGGGGEGKEPPKSPGGMAYEDDPFEFGKRAVDETQFIYAKFNRPRMFRNFGAIFGTFRTFVINFLEFLARLWGRGSTRAVLAAFGMLWFFSGLKGMPFAENIKYLLEEIWGTFTHRKPDIESEMREWGYDHFGGPEFMDWIIGGPNRKITGVDIGASVGVGDVIPMFTKDFTQDPFASIIGAPAEVLYKRPKRAYELSQEGQTYRAVEAVAPEFMRNPMVAARVLKEGLLDRSGGQIVGQKELTAADIGKKAVGFMPTKIAKAYEREEAKARISERTELVKKDVMRRMANLVRAGKKEEATRVLETEAHGVRPEGAPDTIQFTNKPRPKDPADWIILDERTLVQRLGEAKLSPEMRGILKQPVLQRPAWLKLNKIYGGAK